MQKIIFSAALLSILFASCTNYKAKFEELSARNSEMEQEYNAIKQEESLMKGEYTETIETLNAIEDTLRSINSREAAIRELAAKKQLENGSVSQRDQIMGQIEALVQANKNAQSNARSLQTKLKNFKAENEQIKKLIEQANQKIEAKEKELADSRNTIDQLNTTLNKLEGQLLEKSGELEKAYESLKAEKKNLETTNTQLSQTVKDLEGKTNFISDCARAYVVCGTKKALRQNDILKKLNMNLTSEYKENVKKINQTINFYEKDQINCDEGNIIKILPERPADSYSIDGGTVKIIDFKKFWATDKVVVLVKED